MSNTPAKIYVTYDQIHKLCEKIVHDIAQSSWTPDCIVAIAGGGLIPARIMRVYLKVPVYVVGLQRYDSTEELSSVPQRIQWLDDPDKQLAGKRVLVVDEVDDTRATLAYCAPELLKHNIHSLRIAVLHQKQKPKKGELPAAVEQVYAGQVVNDEWINYPWESTNIDEHNRLAGQ